MQADWNRIVAWVEARVPELLDALEPPAEREDLAEAERRLSMRLPKAIRDFYALQNGTPAFAVLPSLDTVASAFGPLPLDEVEILEVEEEDDPKRLVGKRPWKKKRRGGRGGGRGDAGESEYDVDPGVRAEFWNPAWLPFAAANDRGDYLLVDFAPDRGGKHGQVLEWRLETNERLLVAPSLDAFLRRLADGLEAGKYVWDDRLGVRAVE